MWKLVCFLQFLLLISSSQAATLNCTFNGTACPLFVLSSVRAMNDPITVLNPPFTPYVDSITQQLSIRDYFNEPQFPQNIVEFPNKIFDIFNNLTTFIMENAFNIFLGDATELMTDAVYNCARITFFAIRGGSIKHVAAGFARTCGLINDLTLQAKIQTIDENALQGLTSLKFLTMNQNGLSCLPLKLFQYNSELVGVYMSENKLKAIHSQQFVGLTKLRVIYLNSNQISFIPNFNINTTAVDRPDATLLIEMTQNPIQAISPDFLSYIYRIQRMLPNTNYLELKFGDESYALNDPASTTTCVHLNEMIALNSPVYRSDINYFRIGTNAGLISTQDSGYRELTTCYSAFTADMGSDVLALTACPVPLTTTTTSTNVSTTVTTSQSSTSSSPPVSSGKCATDKVCRYYLDWNNQYTCVIDGAEGTVTSISGSHYLTYTDLDLTRLYFKNSFLSLVPKIIFQKFPNLKYLHVADCGLNIIDDKTFNACGNLEFLDASNNQISRFVETSLKNCTKLKLIDLTGNPIDHISNDLYQFDPALERIHLRRLDDWVLA